MAYKLPPYGIQKEGIKKMLDEGTHFKILIIHEVMLNEYFKLLIDTGGIHRLTLYTFRAKEKHFASLDSIYKFCQELGIPEFQVMVKK